MLSNPTGKRNSFACFALLGSLAAACSNSDPRHAGALTSTHPTHNLDSGAGAMSEAGSDATSLLLGDGKVSNSARSGYVFSCVQNFSGGGAQASGDWLDAVAGTWDPSIKPAVQGAVNWPSAMHTFSVAGAVRTLTSNGLPEGLPTGTFPVAASDPAYQYDRNPNSIRAQQLSYTVPAMPSAAANPNCLDLGAIGITTVGVAFFNALDAQGRDAAAHEIQDLCDGHPERSGEYHYHSISSCLIAQTIGRSTLVGYALDGYGIYVERDANDDLLTNADLDECHGRTSSVDWDGTPTTLYHYVVTQEYPYTLGCYHGTPMTN
ncbi:MAG TPA: YHYH protein [Polyangiaceae bacterium]|nr:YHYH protein [Polyangiaceae bacterium]